MDWRERIGQYSYVIMDNKIEKVQIKGEKEKTW